MELNLLFDSDDISFAYDLLISSNEDIAPNSKMSLFNDEYCRIDAHGKDEI